MKNRILLSMTLGLVLAGCSQGGSGGGSGGQNPTAQGSDQQFHESYQLKLNDCDTGKHVFSSSSSPDDVKKQLCEALQDDSLNKSCAEPLRQEFFNKKCSGYTWNPKYQPVNPQPSQPDTPINTPDYATENKVRNALKNLLVEKYDVAPSISGHEKQAVIQFSEDMMSCGLSYLGAKCLDYITVAGN